MQGDDKHAGNKILLQFGCLWLLAALALAWCLVGLGFDIPPFHALFPGKYQRVLQAHLDFLIMSALILGFYGARSPLPWHVRWAMGVGAFTNSSLFLLMALFPGWTDHSRGRTIHPRISGLYAVQHHAHQLRFWQGRGDGPGDRPCARSDAAEKRRHVSRVAFRNSGHRLFNCIAWGQRRARGLSRKSKTRSERAPSPSCALSFSGAPK